MSQLVTVGLPVYNGEKYLRQALESLLSQSHASIELIVSDNASTDATERICLEVAAKDKRVFYIRQSLNNGPIWNFNFVLGQAKGDYFMWAAHDDLWDKEWVARLLNNHKSKTAISFGHVVNIDERGKIIKTYPRSEFSGNRLMRLIRFYLAEDTHGKPNLIYGLYKTDLLKKLGFKLYGKSQYGQDMQVILSCLPYGGIASDPSVLLYKRVETAVERSMTCWAMLSSIFLLNRIGSYWVYPRIVPNLLDKLILTALFPIKYLASFVYSFVTRAFRYFPTTRSARRV